ncbi:murein lipoprotein [Bathymodiolus japonicus methanotrophic gill symbiont]|uniref:Lpp/OprI family alanine-zipper lipoprotein n=1 Tax=Bathymodiolus japonicus methanotrophic gill symbiont TaxID=113269 RepID=UPI001B4C401A|nr:Lpp/OprI family alanine-zipper lipoprotein [Bathymodiolus japonicus methanotrophic gill symbiont]GFO70990.1 murein lipoprotein [Bathymodiolus japonicus methanotrophic gill symbiont]
MIKLLKVSAVILGTSLAIGCASTGDLEKLQADVDSLKAQTAAISAKADSAASDAKAAADNALAATAAANRAADSAAETNHKLDRMLNKAMMK